MSGPGRWPIEHEENTALSRRQVPKRRRDRQYDPLRPTGGFRHEPKNWFEKLIHNRYAFPVISVLGGVVLILGTFLIFFGSGSTSSSSAVRQKASDEAVRGGTAPASIASPGAETSTPGPSPTPSTQRSYSSAPPFTLDPSASYTATIKTDKGDIVLKLDQKAAPQAVNNFVFLAKNGFYDGLSFQRVVPDFVAQAGAPNADGSGGPGYTIPDENSPLQHDAGAVAMAQAATTGNSGGSQFYIALAPLTQQDGKDTVFGQVTSGLDILKQLPRRDPKDANPAPALKIDSITIRQQ